MPGLFLRCGAHAVAALAAIAALPGALSAGSDVPVSTSTHIAGSPRQTPANYKLNTDDELTIRVSDMDEFSNLTTRVDAQGDVNLPLIGYVHVASMTTHEAETVLRSRLEKYSQNPEVFVSVEQFRSQPVSVLGSVRNAGVYEIEGRKTLFEVLSQAGGLAEDAGYRIAVTRRLESGRLPLPDAHDDPTGKFSVGSVNVKAILDGTRPQDNIDIMPQDVLSVPKAEMIYVVGAVTKGGAFTLGTDQTISALQALSAAEGLSHGLGEAPAPQNARILRLTAGRAERTEVPINLKAIMEKRAPDVQLVAGDILFVPISKAHNATVRAIEAALQAASIAVYRIP